MGFLAPVGGFLAQAGSFVTAGVKSAAPALTGLATLAGAAAELTTGIRGNPDITDPNVAIREEQRLEKERIRKRTTTKGLPSTNILTSPQGAANRADIERKTLLGG